MKEIILFNISVPAYIYAPVVYFVWVTVLLFIKKVVFGRIQIVIDKPIKVGQFIKRLHERYAKEGIIIPYPIWAINETQEKAK